jgi:3-hydroxyisobutyrate dehydrogenase
MLSQQLGRLVSKGLGKPCSYGAKRAYSTGKAPKKVGFLGLGEMGLRMAKNLSRKGVHVVAFDPRPEPVQALATEFGRDLVTGVTAAHEVLVPGIEAVVTMLPGPKHVLETYSTSPTSLLSTLKARNLQNVLFVDSSTIDPTTARTVQAEVVKTGLGAQFVDAPVSGGVRGAEEGTLTFMVGSDSQALFERVSLLLTLMGKNIVFCGGPGNGQVAKVANNLALAIQMIGTSEAMNLGTQLGMDPKILAGIFNTSTARCWSSDSYNPVPGVMPNVPSSRGYTGGFGVDLMAKDLGLAINAANAIKAPVPLGATAHQFYNSMSNHGYGGLDFSSAFEYLQKKHK